MFQGLLLCASLDLRTIQIFFRMIYIVYLGLDILRTVYLRRKVFNSKMNMLLLFIFASVLYHRLKGQLLRFGSPLPNLSFKRGYLGTTILIYLNSTTYFEVQLDRN